ncbi:MAG: hypothetical protein AB7R55_23980 [Gemmatimonadales bacterium]
MREQLQLILQSLQTTWDQVAALTPRLVVVVALLTVGWLLSGLAQRLVVRTLRALKLDAAAEHTGVEDFLVRGGVRFTAVTLIGQVVYWGLLLIFVLAGFNVLGLGDGPALVDRVGAYLPDVVAAVVVLVFGSIFARFVRGIAAAYLNNMGVKGSANIAILVQLALLAFVALLALEQLQIDLALLTSAFQMAFGACCLALALAFGLGGRGWAESVIERFGKPR